MKNSQETDQTKSNVVYNFKDKRIAIGFLKYLRKEGGPFWSHKIEEIFNKLSVDDSLNMGVGYLHNILLTDNVAPDQISNTLSIIDDVLLTTVFEAIELSIPKFHPDEELSLPETDKEEDIVFIPRLNSYSEDNSFVDVRFRKDCCIVLTLTNKQSQSDVLVFSIDKDKLNVETTIHKEHILEMGLVPLIIKDFSETLLGKSVYYMLKEVKDYTGSVKFKYVCTLM